MKYKNNNLLTPANINASKTAHSFNTQVKNTFFSEKISGHTVSAINVDVRSTTKENAQNAVR